MKKMYRLYCEYCGYNRYTDGTDIQDLVPYKRSPIMSGIPKYNPKTKKTDEKNFINLPKQFKCPKCGKLISARKIKWTEGKNENLDAGSQDSTT
jgi:rubredoxin